MTNENKSTNEDKLGAMESECPCGTRTRYGACCGRMHSSATSAPTAEALMRSRYSAFAVGAMDYLLDTWHPDTRPLVLDPSPDHTWVGLEIIEVERGGMLDAEGIVDFVARYRVDAMAGELRERSSFTRYERRWVYVSGEIGEPYT